MKEARGKKALEVGLYLQLPRFYLGQVKTGMRLSPIVVSKCQAREDVSWKGKETNKQMNKILEKKSFQIVFGGQTGRFN